MWEAIIDSIGKNGSSVQVQVTYYSDSEEIRESYNFDSPTLIEQTIKNKIEQLEQRDLGLSELVLGKVTKTPKPEPIPPPVIDQNLLIFQKDFINLKKYEKLITLELVLKTDPVYLALKTKVKNMFKPEYLDGIQL